MVARLGPAEQGLEAPGYLPSSLSGRRNRATSKRQRGALANEKRRFAVVLAATSGQYADTPMRLPRPRFTLRQLMLCIALIAVGIAMLIGACGSEAFWVGEASVPLEFPDPRRLRGKADCRGIGRAHQGTIRLPGDHRAGWPRLPSHHDDGRRAFLDVSANPVSELLLALAIKAAGYGAMTCDLHDLTRAPQYHYAPSPPPIVIRLAPVPQAQ